MDKQKIVIFDFDGTITSKDTMLDLTLKHFGLFKFLFGLLKISHKLLLYKCGIISNTKAKEDFLSCFYNKMEYKKFIEICTNYSLKEIDKIIKPKALKKINFFKSQNYRISIITASIEEWIIPWAIKNGFEIVIGSKISVKNDLVTGKIIGKNCYGQEKVNRFISYFGPFENYYVISFGDSKGDKEILAKSNESYYKKYE